MPNFGFAVLVTTLFSSFAVLAQTEPANNIGAVEASVTLPDAPADLTAAVQKPQPQVTFGHDGLLIRPNSSSFKVRVHGYLQGDGRFFSTDVQNGSKDTLLFRRVRPIVEGTLFKGLNFRFMPDFGQGMAVIQDAYLESSVPRVARVRLGKFKQPVGLEQLQSDPNLMFVERSLATNLIPNRDLGVQVGGDVLDKSITYAVGFFNGVVDGGNATFDWHTGNAVAARLFLQPFHSRQDHFFQGFGIGLGATTGRDDGPLPKYKTIGQDTFFKYSSGAVSDGQHNRLSPQTYYYHGPLGLIGEYAISSQAVRKGATTRRVRNEGWQVESSLLLTGGQNSYEGVRPKHAFEPYRDIRHWGAVELVTRYSTLRVDPKAFDGLADPTKSAQKASEWGVGLNWYPNRHVKLMTDYEQTAFHMIGNKGHLPTEKVVMSRIQLAF